MLVTATFAAVLAVNALRGQFAGIRFLGQGAGIWGLIASTALFVGVSLLTTAPRARADAFITRVNDNLEKHRAI